MATVNNAIEHLKLNESPYWWLYSGNTKVGQWTKSDNLEDSIQHLQTVVNLLPDGNYKLKSSDKESNHSGANHFNFSKSQNQHAQTTTPMVSARPSNNVYGVDDAVYQKIREEERQRILVEQMHADVMTFFKEWPDYKKKIDYCYDHLKDDDENGIPDFLEMAKRGTDIVKSGIEAKNLFTGAKRFSDL